MSNVAGLGGEKQLYGFNKIILSGKGFDSS